MFESSGEDEEDPVAEPLVIVAAVNGGMQMSRDGAKVPITPEEIAEDAWLCREAGAAIVHIHARDENGRNTGDIDGLRRHHHVGFGSGRTS